MPLPPALLERLKKRGIVPPKNQEEEEEVIAEDHDSDADDDSDSDEQDDGSQRPSVRKKYKPMSSVIGCPNKVNIYHDCTEYCQERYGKGKVCPSPRTERKYRTLLKRFPLPLKWLDVWEPGTARYYFWNTETDEVSWLPPLHPKAKISLPVSRLRENMRPQIDDGSSANSSEESGDDSGTDESDPESEGDEPEAKRRAPAKSLRDGMKTWDNRPYHKNRQLNKRNDLDPMDPSSYSDSCPRGRWSDGLSRDRDE